MRIAYLAAGAAGMYCGSCLHDNTLAAALMAMGEDVVLVPIYTPIRTDETDVSVPRVFFGGINAYLQQKVALFRHTPRWFDRWLDHPRLLRLLAGRGAAVDPAKLGAMTVSMLRGEHGNQRKELDKLVDWLLDEVRPDVVHLSNSMMLGLARKIAERCGPPVVCSLSGEDIFLEKLTAPHYQQARSLLKERAAEVHAFVAMNHYYADAMANYLDVPRNRVRVIPHGLNLEGHSAGPPDRRYDSGRVGFLARICADKGLHLLIDACETLASTGRMTDFEIHVAGYLGAGDRAYFRAIQDRVAAGPLRDRFVYHGEVDRSEKIALLQMLDLFCLPTVYQESKGLPVLEAMANATPVLLPRHGAFPEMVEATAGGRLFDPGNPQALADALAELLPDGGALAEYGRAGRAAVCTQFHAGRMAEATQELYTQLSAG